MNTTEHWLTEIISSQKRTLRFSVLTLILAIMSIPIGYFLLYYEPELLFTFGESGKPPVEPVDYSGMALFVVISGFALLLGTIYLWQFHTPSGIRRQLIDLQDLMSATLETKRHKYKLQLNDGTSFTINYHPYRWSSRELCGFQIQSSPMGTVTDAKKQTATRYGFAISPASVLHTNCSIDEFFPRTLLLYTTIQRLTQIQN